MGFRIGSALAAVMLLGAVGVAQADPIGNVVSTSGPTGSVLVVRDNKVYSLGSNDPLFENDQVFTRSNGNAEIKYFKCTKSISGAEFLSLTANCAEPATSLKASDVIKEVKIGAQGVTVGTLAATPGILALVAGAGALASNGNNTPSSP